MAAAVGACVLVVFGCGLGLGGLTRQFHPTLPPLAETADPEWTPPPPMPGKPSGPTLGRSMPTRVSIGAIGVRAKVKPVGIGIRGDLGVPDVDSEYAGWYERGPSPGEAGPAVIVGHVDSHTTGPAVFYYLGTLERGNDIDVARRDGRVATFAVDRVATYPKREFPYAAVFAPTPSATLRLVTCGGHFDEAEGSYTNNTVVYATLTSVDKR
ncbi:MAG TPA: class F sortase [Stackebrandtia sp.]|uniref:class F sortase n=1 Tax=Stackebrandtia sp. TaxID=2023065 RepID=UPI002D285A8B|nr:class F sortase [Stackebrandtia sp.]HZE38470.1 class F sortase [Stackebrandtia sp.]